MSDLEDRLKDNPKYDGLVDMATKAAPLKYIPSSWCTDAMISTVIVPYIPPTEQITATVPSELHVIGDLSAVRTALPLMTASQCGSQDARRKRCTVS